MFQYIRNTLRRHSKKLLWTTGVISLSYLFSIYVSRKIKEFQEQLKEENATRDLIKKRFAQTQKDCYMTFLSFLPVLIEPIYKELNIEQITKELKLARKPTKPTNNEGSEIISDDLTTTTQSQLLDQGSGPDIARKQTKVELWQELKMKSLTRFLTLVYAESLLIIHLHLQLNIISRKSYLKTALRLASTKEGLQFSELPGEIEDEENMAEQAFLSYTWWLLNEGSLKLKVLVEHCVGNVFDKVSVRDELNMDQFAALIHQTQQLIDSKLKENTKYDDGNVEVPAIISILFPPTEKEEMLLQNTNSLEFLASFNLDHYNKEALEKMNKELKTYLVSNQVQNLTGKIAALGISSILPKVDSSLISKHGPKNKENAISIPESDSTTKQGNDEKITEIEQQSWKLALILGVLTPQTQELSNRRIDNPVLYAMNNIGDLDGLSASVYSNFDI